MTDPQTDESAANDDDPADNPCARDGHIFDEYGLCFECDAVDTNYKTSKWGRSWKV